MGRYSLINDRYAVKWQNHLSNHMETPAEIGSCLLVLTKQWPFPESKEHPGSHVTCSVIGQMGDLSKSANKPWATFARTCCGSSGSGQVQVSQDYTTPQPSSGDSAQPVMNLPTTRAKLMASRPQRGVKVWPQPWLENPVSMSKSAQRKWSWLWSLIMNYYFSQYTPFVYDLLETTDHVV